MHACNFHFNLFFILSLVLSRPSFTSRTPNKDQKAVVKLGGGGGGGGDYRT